jgi:hypothetical protein
MTRQEAAMITILFLLGLYVVFVALTIFDRGRDKLFLPRLAVFCSLVVVAAVVLFDRMVNY